jgi:hypothetical protein
VGCDALLGTPPSPPLSVDVDDDVVAVVSFVLKVLFRSSGVAEMGRWGGCHGDWDEGDTSRDLDALLAAEVERGLKNPMSS